MISVCVLKLQLYIFYSGQFYHNNTISHDNFSDDEEDIHNDNPNEDKKFSVKRKNEKIKRQKDRIVKAKANAEAIIVQ